MEFSGSHILSIDQFSRSDVEKLFNIADSLEPYSSKIKVTRVLEGAILGNMFFEPSTRTRISFGASFGFAVMGRISLLIGRFDKLIQYADSSYFYATYWGLGIVIMGLIFWTISNKKFNKRT